jgi:hypothetical protein
MLPTCWDNIFDMSATDKNVCCLRGEDDRHKSRHCQPRRGGEERHFGLLPTKERKSPSKKRKTGSASSMDMQGERTQREEGHKGREDMKGGNVIDSGLKFFTKATS